MQKIDPSNALFTIAADLVNHTSKNIFLTGRAGTGKTTFLKYIKENCPKQMVVVAPTGVAAINAGGVTIHSFFQLPFGPFIPEAKAFKQKEDVTNRHSLLSRLRLNNDRRKILRELEVLIIDEISMVRCDVLDAIDLVLRHIRYRYTERFGGVQVLFIGDMFQLPPVVKESEWNVLREYYQGPYFFDSLVMKEEPPVYIEFTKIYRQTEQTFIDLLNRVRNNEMEEQHFLALHDRYKPEFFGESSDGCILLTTHNEKAREINSNELTKLKGRMFTYRAEVKEDFPSTAFPADELLQLKIGTQVMFIKNDTDKAKRYFNGKIGIVAKLEEEKIFVQCKDDDSIIEVGKEKWENIRYALDKSTRQLNEQVLGTFCQYPLRLAWAITIHKSQGLTFEKAVIDAGKAFAPGQVYVALSRCTNLGGMVLHSKITPNALNADDRIVQFTKNILPIESLRQEFVQAKKAYQEKIILSLFEFGKVLNEVKGLQRYLLERTTSFNTEVLPWVGELLNKISALQTTSEKFHQELRKLFLFTKMAEDNTELQERIKIAADWFSSEIRAVIEIVLKSPAVTDSTIHAREYNELLKETFVQLTMQNFLLQGFGGKFDMESFHRRKKSFVVPSFVVNAYASASEKKVELSHSGLYYQLKKLRDSICEKRNLPIYLVAGSKTLEEMTSYLPQTLEELEKITGFGKVKLEAYGNDFLSIIKEYAEGNNLRSSIVEKSPKRQRKETRGSRVETKAETLKLFQAGKVVSEIAKERNLTVQTIESHLSHFVRDGLIKIEDLVNREKIVLIEPIAKGFTGGSITALKARLGSNVSFGEIRLVLAAIEYQNLSSHIHH